MKKDCSVTLVKADDDLVELVMLKLGTTLESNIFFTLWLILLFFISDHLSIRTELKKWINQS